MLEVNEDIYDFTIFSKYTPGSYKLGFFLSSFLPFFLSFPFSFFHSFFLLFLFLIFFFFQAIFLSGGKSQYKESITGERIIV